MIDKIQIAWLAGIIEGEGSFLVRGGSPSIAVQMTDRDIVARIAALLGAPVGANPRKPKGKDTYLPVWTVRLHGSKAIAWMMTLYSFLGIRRRAKVQKIISAWRASKRMPRAGRHDEQFKAICHPTERRVGNGLCRFCYHRERRAMFRAGVPRYHV